VAVNLPGTISVVIPTYNGITLLPECLDSVRKQELLPDEIILVDDGSCDGTQALVSQNYPEVCLVRLDPNRGFAAAANEGIRRAKGEYIALLNNDARAAPRWLSELKKALDERPSVGSCSSKMLFADGSDTINSIGIGFTRAGTAFDVGYGQKDGPQFNRPRPVFGACAGAAMYRRKLFDSVGLFDEDFYMWYEDADLSFRAQLAGYKCFFVPTAIVYHIGGGTVSPQDAKHTYYCSRNQILMLAKNLPSPLRLRYFRRLFSACLKHSVKTLLQGNLTVSMGYLAALQSLRYFLKKRELTSLSSVISIDELSDLLRIDCGGEVGVKSVLSVRNS